MWLMVCFIWDTSSFKLLQAAHIVLFSSILWFLVIITLTSQDIVLRCSPYSYHVTSTSSLALPPPHTNISQKLSCTFGLTLRPGSIDLQYQWKKQNVKLTLPYFCYSPFPWFEHFINMSFSSNDLFVFLNLIAVFKVFQNISLIQWWSAWWWFLTPPWAGLELLATTLVRGRLTVLACYTWHQGEQVHMVIVKQASLWCEANYHS